MIEKNFYLEAYENHYINTKESLSINKVKNILTNFCHMQDLINTNINDLADCFGSVLKNLTKNENRKKLEIKNLPKKNFNLEIISDLEKKLEIKSNFEIEKLNLESKNFAEKKFTFKKKQFYSQNFDKNEFKNDKDKTKTKILNNLNIDKNLNIKNYLEKRNIFFKRKFQNSKKVEEINKEVYDMKLEEINEKFTSDKDDADNILNIKRELKFFKKKISKKRKK